MFDAELESLERILAANPEDPAAFFAYVDAGRRARPRAPLFPGGMPPKCRQHWTARPDDRALAALFLKDRGLAPSSPGTHPGLWWSQELRIARGADDDFYDPHTGWPLTARRVSDQAQMVLVPAGEFLSGRVAGERRQTGAFYIDRFPVTRYQLRNQASDRAANEAPPEPGYGDRNPAVNVSGFEARAYAAAVGGVLPSETQWEKAARGTDGRTYPWGDENPTHSHANWFWDEGQGDRYAFMSQTARDVDAYPLDVSPFGLRGAAGNVKDWGEPTDRDDDLMVVLGGNCWDFSWIDLQPGCRGSPRHGSERELRVGFRVLVAVTPSDSCPPSSE